MSGTRGGVDPEALDQFLASAPPSLRPWAEAQREALSTAPGLEDLTDDDVRAAEETAASGTRRKEPATVAQGINKVLVALLAAAIVLLVQSWGRPASEVAADGASSAMPSLGAGMTTFAELDATRVAELEEQLKKDAKNVEALRELGQLHQDAGQWQTANDYWQRRLDAAPDDVDALLASGVYRFNTGDVDGALELWTRVTEVAPTKPEGYYNLGFAHMAKQPPDVAGARAAWEKLIEVSPDSELATTAKQHLDRLGKDG